MRAAKIFVLVVTAGIAACGDQGADSDSNAAARAAEGDAADMSAYREFTGKSVEEALRNASVDAHIHVYDGVGHAFANPSGALRSPSINS